MQFVLNFVRLIDITLDKNNKTYKEIYKDYSY